MKKISELKNWRDGIGEILHGDCFDFMKKIPDNSIDLVLTDPPYFKIRGDFDFEFENFSHFQKMIENLARECSRILKKNGSLFIFGHAKNIAYVQIIFDKFLKLQNSLVWEKNNSTTRRGENNFRIFTPITERILFYSHLLEDFEFTTIEENGKKRDRNIEVFSPIRNYLNSELLKFAEKNNLSKKEAEKKIDEFCGCARMSYHFFGEYQWNFPTRENYEKIQKGTNVFQKEYEILRKEYEILRKEYEILRKEYEILRRYFSQEKIMRDVFKFKNCPNHKWKHPTRKPEPLISDLILKTSRKNALVFDPFGGSFTTARAAKDLGRKWISCDLEKEYCEIGEERLRQNNLF